MPELPRAFLPESSKQCRAKANRSVTQAQIDTDESNRYAGVLIMVATEIRAETDQVFCLRMSRHLLQGHVRTDSHSLYRLLRYISTRQVTHQVYEVRSLLHYAATALLRVPPLWLGNVVVGAGVPSHYGRWGDTNLQRTVTSGQLRGLKMLMQSNGSL